MTLAYFWLMLRMKFYFYVFFYVLRVTLFPNRKLLFFHTSMYTIYCLQLLGFSMFVFTSEGKTFIFIYQIVKSEKIING